MSPRAPAFRNGRYDVDAVSARIDETLRRDKNVPLRAASDADARCAQRHLLHAINALDPFDQLINLRAEDRAPERPPLAFGVVIGGQRSEEVIQTLLDLGERLGLPELREEFDGRL